MRSLLVVLLVLLASGNVASALAANKAGPAGHYEGNGKVAANWDRDLFAIFREEAELEEYEPAFMAPKMTTKVVVPMAPEAKKSAPPPVVVKAKLPELKLKGIVVSGNQSAALVDGKVVREGELLAGWTVTKISRHGLLVSGPDGEKEYKLLADRERATVRASSVPAE